MSDQKEGQGWLYEVYEGDGRLGRLRGLYSRFRPTRPDADPPFRSHPAGDIPGSRTYPEVLSDRAAEPIQLVTQTLNLDSHELFSQLCVSVNLVQVGPRRGVFLSCIDVLRKAIPRVWREWLAEGAESLDGPSIETMDLEDEKQSRRVIWADSGKNVGLRARVRERKWGRNAPILMRKDDDEAISYTLEFEGKQVGCRISLVFHRFSMGVSSMWFADTMSLLGTKNATLTVAELLVRTTHVLLAVEKSLLETSANSTKAMVFGSFVSSSTP